MRITTFIIISLSITLTSCFKDDGYVIEPIPIQEVKIPYSIYEDQVYFRLSDTAIVSHNNYAAWDLGFESSASGYHIILNTSKFMYAGNTESTDFSAITSNTASLMLFDRSSGSPDSTAIGNWGDFSNPLNPIFPKNVYIINRGVDELGNSFGFKKIVFEKLENNSYYLHYSNLDNSDEHFYQIPKDNLVNHVQFSFDNGGNTTAQQPNKADWDILFTKYSTILFDDNGVPTPYLVRGAYINKGLSVAKDTITDFYSIGINSVGNYSFSTKQDAIGFDWKDYIGEKYIVKPYFTYIIKDNKNNYFKLRFTGFYNNIENHPNYGEKGFTSFELVKLN